MRDRFPLLVVGGLVLLAVLGSFLVRGARRGAFADPLSTFRSEPDGARALYLVLEQQGLQVRRHQQSLERLEPGLTLVLLGPKVEGADTGDQPAQDGSDAGVADAGDDTPAERTLASLRSPPLEEEERERLLEHVSAGATLVYVPRSWHQDPLLDALGVQLLRADPALGLRTLAPAQPTPFTRGVQRLEARVAAFLALEAGAVPLLVDVELEQPVAAVVPRGQGRVVVIAAPDLAMNRRLALADNARFWASLVGSLGARQAVAFDEYHHGFTGEPSMGDFAARYGLQYALAQLLVGVALWALALTRFGRAQAPAEALRVGATDALFATSRLYREGRHFGHAAQAITRQFAAACAARAGVRSQAEPQEIAVALEARGRGDLARALGELHQAAQAAASEHDVLGVARLAALARRTLNPRPSRTPP